MSDEQVSWSAIPGTSGPWWKYENGQWTPTQEKSMSERDTHFQGFARRLLAELFALQGGQWHDLVRWESDVIAESEQLIAQRAFDLAEHVYNHTTEAMTLFSSFQVIAEEGDIPDLTAWPKPPET
jgi:hypothetical protein